MRRMSQAKVAQVWGFHEHLCWFYSDPDGSMVCQIATNPVWARMELSKMGFDMKEKEIMATPYNIGKLHYSMRMEEIESPLWVRTHMNDSYLDDEEVRKSAEVFDMWARMRREGSIGGSDVSVVMGLPEWRGV